MSLLFRLYLKGAGTGFALTAASNIFMSNLISNPPIDMHKEPRKFTEFLLIKSFAYGLCWPLIPIEMFRDSEGFCFVGKGFHIN